MATSIYDHKVPDVTHDFYDVSFHDEEIFTTVTDTPSYVDSWIDEIERIHYRRLHRLIVDLDIEWRPNRFRNQVNPVATLQLCVGHRCLIFQIPRSHSIPQSLVILRNRSYTFTGVGIKNDVEKLREDYNLVVARIADLRTLAAKTYGIRELKNAGIKDLSARVLGKEMKKPKSIIMSNWDRKWLSLAQVKYACIDAFLSFEIGRILLILTKTRSGS